MSVDVTLSTPAKKLRHQLKTFVSAIRLLADGRTGTLRQPETSRRVLFAYTPRPGCPAAH